MKHIENVVIGKPIVEPEILFAKDHEDWVEIEEPKTLFTEERNLAVILKEIGIVPSVSEVRRNKPQYAKVLDHLDFLEVKWGKKKIWVLVGE